MSAKAMAIYAALCGWTLARAPPRSGDRRAIPAHLGGRHALGRAICALADACADLNERDYKALAAAVDAGRIAAAKGL